MTDPGYPTTTPSDPVLPDPTVYMGPPPPPMDDPLTTQTELASWIPGLDRIPDDMVPFADKVLRAVAVMVRQWGSVWWTHDNIPLQGKVIADVRAKNFYEHPSGVTEDRTGPLLERYSDAVVSQWELSEAEKIMLASLAQEDPMTPTEAVVKGVWGLSTTRGPLETHGDGEGVIYVPWWQTGSKLLPYYATGAMGSPTTT